MREELREATGAIHARIDASVGHMVLASDADYAAFLSAQYAARSLTERMLAETPPIDLPPPPRQTDVLAEDLSDLGASALPASFAFTVDSPTESLGAAWVLAGSSMGNRTLLVRRRKAGLDGPTRFLSDPRMPAYFKELLTILNAHHSDSTIRDAIAGARRTFVLFETVFCRCQLEQAA